MRAAPPRRPTRSGRVALTALAVLLALPAIAAAQPVARAGFVDDGSFTLPGWTGPEGSGPEIARGIALGPDGTVHVLGEQNGVFVYDRSGSFLRRYGAESIDRLEAITIDGEGNAYLLDAGARTVRIFGPDGELRHQAGYRGDGTGSLDEPVDLAVDPDGRLYVLDRDRKQVQLYSRDGTAIHTFVLPPDAGDPRAIAVGVNGEMFIADRRQNTAVVTLPPLTEALVYDGQPLQSGRLLLRGADLRNPVALATTATGTVVVANESDGVLWTADAAGGPPVGTNDRLYGGKGTGRGSFETLVDVAVAGSDELLVLDRGARKVERVRLLLEGDREPLEVLDYPVVVQRIAPGIAGAILATAPTGRGSAWFATANSEGNGLQILEAEMRPAEGVGGETLRVPGGAAGGVSWSFATQVERATDVALNDTLAVVAEERRHRFHVFDLRTGESIGTFGDNYRDERRLRDPASVALFADGRVAVADRGNDRIAVFSPDLATLLGTYPFPDVRGVRLTPDDRLFAWDDEGFLAGEVPLAGGSMIPLPAPVAIGGIGSLDFDGNGNLYVVQKNVARVAIMDARQQELLARIGAESAMPRADRISLDEEGNLFLTELRPGAATAFHWGIDIPALEGMNATWTAQAARLRWTPVEGTFVTGYRVEGSDAEDGPYETMLEVDEAEFEASAGGPGWLRVAPLTLTGSTGDPSEPIPLHHLAALADFGNGEWEGALTSTTAAWETIGSGAVEADPELGDLLGWAGFYSASELERHAEVLEWHDALGGEILADQAFEHLSRLSAAHTGLRQDDRAVVRAKEALRVARLARPRPPAERLVDLHRAVYEGGLTTANWADVASSGEALIQAAPLEATGAFLASLARAHYETGDMARSADLVQIALEDPEVDPAARRELSVLAFMAAAGAGEVDTALGYVEEIGESIPIGLFTDFQLALAQLRLETGEVSESRAELLFLFGDAVPAEPLLRPRFGETVLGIYGAMVQEEGPRDPEAMATSETEGGAGAEAVETPNAAAGDAGADADAARDDTTTDAEGGAVDPAGAAADSLAADAQAAPEPDWPPVLVTADDFLAALATRMPTGAEEMWAGVEARADTVALRTDTELKIGAGLQHVRDGLFRDALGFFSEEIPLLTDAQKLIAAQAHAWALYSLGEEDEADDAFRVVFDIDEDFDLDENVAAFEALFGFSIFTEEQLAHFRRVGPIL